MESQPYFSIDEFDSKAFQKTIQPSDLVNSKAILTHYLHNISNGISKHYKKGAERIIKKYVTYKNDHSYSSEVKEQAIQKLLFEVENVPFPTPHNFSFKFIDLFAGIGGFRIALQNLGGKCVFSSEWNLDAQKTYRANFGEVPFGDITSKDTKKSIPEDFDILCGGFPCQAFSIAGYRKGFSDTRGTLFFDIEQILLHHKPKVVFLENVKNLISHDSGRTFNVIIEVLEKKLGYKVYFKVLNSMTHANIPQNRERIFIVAFDPKRVKRHKEFKFPTVVKLNKSIQDILENKRQPDIFYYHKDHKYYHALSNAITKKNTVYQWRRVYVRENKSNVCPTLTANMGAGGHNVPLIKDDFGIRKLTPFECFAFQGYPMDKYILPPIANSKLYMQAGNSVTTNLIQRICSEILEVL